MPAISGIEGVWERLKQAARQYARDGERPSVRQAEQQIAQWIYEARISPRPPSDVVQFYALELLRMIDAADESGAAQH
jgi:hypothetical protein